LNGKLLPMKKTSIIWNQGLYGILWNIS